MLRRYFLLLCSLLLMIPAGSAEAENWPGWRGPRGDGSSTDASLPTIWNGETGQNIVWKAPLAASGHSSPIVWGDRVFVVGCDEASEDRVLLSIDRATGKTVWQRTVLHAPLERKHKLNSFASGTPVTDGKLVYVTFLEPDFGSTKDRTPGDMVVAAYDFAGEKKWEARPGRFASVHGFCSSPILFEDKIIINGDHDGDSYLVAMKAASGEIVWKVNRAGKTRSYVTPIIRQIDGRTQMLLSGSKAVTSFNPADGAIHWTMAGPTQQFVASLVYNGKYVFLTAGFPEHHILAIKPDGTGTVGDDQIVWRTTKGCSYVPSPIVSGDYFLVVSDQGIASCFDCETGERHWMERLGPHFSASLIEAKGLVYFLADNGQMTVVRPGKTKEVVTVNELGEYIYSSPAVSDGQIFLRGEKHLYCIGEKGAE